MWATVLLSLGLLPAANDNRLTAEVSDDDKPVYSYSSEYESEKGDKVRWTVTDTARSYHTDARMFYVVSDKEKGTIARATKKANGEVVPSSVTMMWTSYTPPRQTQYALTGAITGNADDFASGGMYWSASANKIAAFSGGKLEAKLIDGDKTGKVRVRFASEVTGDKDKGYTYSYTVENLGDRPLFFKWAGFEGKVEPKKTVTKGERSDKLTEQQTDLATIDFEGGEATFAIRANHWAKPK
ncbi:MAG TPA: hypothetical protein VGF55_19530 [Gemmataceae bacterium]|jgi:hypothetical protein